MMTSLYPLHTLLGFFIPLAEFDSETFSITQEVTPEPSFSYFQLISYLLCFVLVLYLASKAARWLGRVAGGRSGLHLRLVDTLHLGPNRAVHLIMVGKQLFLVGAAERNLTLLTEISDPDLLGTIQAELAPPVTGRQGGGKGFADHLKGLLNGGFGEVGSAPPPDVMTPTQRIEERLMKYRTHRGYKSDG
ncbi:MAG TPA: flagellar biosynthetic protein FliO [Firmicutes bacterium]|uniref:FliO/MopB family protein n=1 Tax=Capillibacterium thermochitinicola TaxID=2699427 RepID=UPI00181F82AE|nr:flagellar biosynthetic protein FliO [Capillibacterium thermochitinicola]HHW12407.1 flagellar biosynthetic protein FliO [Bacillota bacterium]